MAKFETNKLPLYAKVILSVVPAILISVAVFFLLISPKQKEIKELNAKIDRQNDEIATSQAKAAKLDILIQENEMLARRLAELQEQLPEEKEISSLLKQVSDLGITAGLNIKSWKPATRTTHPSGIVYEIPVSVDVEGTYHDLGNFLGSLTGLNRIVNINDMKLGGPKSKSASAENLLAVSFRASTFSAVPEAEVVAAAEAEAAKNQPAKRSGKKR
jgi:type IV pilus assembly protein PilO